MINTDSITTFLGAIAALGGYLATVLPAPYSKIAVAVAGSAAVLFSYFTNKKVL